MGRSSQQAKAVIICGTFVAAAIAGTRTEKDRGPAITGSPAMFAKHCARCHGLDGRARTAQGKRAGATDFTSGDWNTDPARAIRIITNGKGEMPSFKSKLKPAEIRSVWNYVRSFRK